MRTSSEEYVAKRGRPAVALCGKVPSSYTMLFTQIGTMPEIRICGWQKPVVLESFQVNFVTF
jgi:hypothetical protein